MTRYEGTRGLPGGWDFGETSCTGGSASLPVMSAYVRVSSQMPCYCLPVVFRVTEKTSLQVTF